MRLRLTIAILLILCGTARAQAPGNHVVLTESTCLGTTNYSFPTLNVTGGFVAVLLAGGGGGGGSGINSIADTNQGMATWVELVGD